MSRARVYREETLQTLSRFFEAIDVLVAHKEIRGIATYCNLYEIDRRHFYEQQKNLNRGFFEIYWMLPLIKDFKVSSDWLLFGKGKMFK